MTYCPRCNQPTVRSETIIEGAVVLGCRTCRHFSVEGSNQWVQAEYGFRDSLRIIADRLKQAKEREKAIMTTPIEDPRWNWTDMI
jgi:NMD protein affecting ribosome stability and mRNA decay